MSLGLALIEPQIPPNTGNIVRLAAATGATVHLIEPLGFSLGEAELRRAGMDYWDEAEVWVHPDWFAFRRAVARERCLYFSAHGTLSYVEAPYARNSVLVFGNETMGMPQRILEKHPERVFRVPMRPGIRSLNLATAVGIVLYEALRQLETEYDGALTLQPAGPDRRMQERDS
jgi:tRNA (cytidine/uridine-2'-O-)-methyltransferase